MFLGAAIALALALATLAGCLVLLRRSREREDRLWGLTGEGLAQVAPDGSVRRASDAFATLVGRPGKDLAGARLTELVHPDDQELLLAALNPLSPDGPVRTASLRVPSDSGAWTLVRLRARAESDAQVVDVALNEFSGGEHAADAFERVFTASPIGMAVVGIDGVVRRSNHRMSVLLGGDRVGERLDSLVSAHDLAAAREQIARLVAGELHAVTLRLGLRHADGSDVPAFFSVSMLRDDAGEPREYIVQARDETDAEALAAEVRHATDHDSLTGLLNRAALLPLLRQLPGQPAALAILDVDGLSAINETCGTIAGDAVIEAVAARLNAAVGPRGALARIGGDEFGVLIADVDAAAAQALVEELVAAVSARPVDVAGERLEVTACAGVALEDDLLSNANEALRQAKLEGHGTTMVFSSRMRERRSNGRDWADKVRRGLQSDRLLLDAQPIVDVLTGEPVQYELLLRMRDDDGTIVRPNAFLGAAKRHGLMGAIDDWVVGQAIALVQSRAQQDDPVEIAVNLSPESIADRAFMARAVGRLVEAPEAGRHLVFELTERSAMSDRGDAGRLMARLGEFGCRFSLDNFGAGSASLRYLKQLPVEFLKLDGQLTRGLPVDPADRAITAAVVQAAHGLGKTVVAECVEDAAILDAVRELGVELAQGLHVGRPQPVAEQLSVATPS